MYCGKCGTLIPEDGGFCPKCGAPSGKTTSPAVTAEQLQRPTRHLRISGLAIASLVCGISGVFLALPAIPAIILGFAAISQIKNDLAYWGKGLAIAGLVLGILVVLLWIIGVIFFAIVAIFQIDFL
jgi:hypothetical protein